MLRRVIGAVAVCGLLTGCSGKAAPTTIHRTQPPGLPLAVANVCEAASEHGYAIEFLLKSDLAQAKSWGGARFSQDISTWLASENSSEAASLRAVVAKDCDRLGGFPKS